MSETRVFHHQDWELQCHAAATDGGHFVPSVVVSKQVWPTRPRNIAVPRGEHADAESAIDAARRSGIQWITNYG